MSFIKTSNKEQINNFKSIKFLSSKYKKGKKIHNWERKRNSFQNKHWIPQKDTKGIQTLFHVIESQLKTDNRRYSWQKHLINWNESSKKVRFFCRLSFEKKPINSQNTQKHRKGPQIDKIRMILKEENSSGIIL